MTKSRPAAELIVVGRIATLAGASGFAWQKGVAIGGGRVLAVGDERDLGALAGPGTQRWRLPDDVLVLPGITDAHLHLMNLVLAERQLDLTAARGMVDALALVERAHRDMAASGDSEGWLLGHGWSLDSLGSWPDAALLETAAPGRPVALYAHDHHSRWVSEVALRAASIDARTPDPEGGLIRRDEGGRPTGILHETAVLLIDDAIPDPAPELLAEALARVAAGLAALGITGCHDPGELSHDRLIRRGPVFYRELAASGRLPLRVHASIRAVQLDRAIELGLTSGQGVEPAAGADDQAERRLADRYRMGWLKLFADGSLGSRSAALLAPYSDAAINPPTGGPSGMYLMQREEITDLLRRAADAGISGQVHAIGDGAVRMVLDVLSGLSANGRLLRRVEHAQLIDPADVPRFGRLNVAASVQPVHLRSDAEPARIAWGSRSEQAFPLRGLVESGALIPFGTDAPVEPADPWPGIAVAVARRDPFDPLQRPTARDQALDLARAVRAACLDPALVAGEEDLGRLMPGYRADLVVVPADGWRGPFDPAALASTRPLATLIDGVAIHLAAPFDP